MYVKTQRIKSFATNQKKSHKINMPALHLLFDNLLLNYYVPLVCWSILHVLCSPQGSVVYYYGEGCVSRYKFCYRSLCCKRPSISGSLSTGCAYQKMMNEIGERAIIDLLQRFYILQRCRPPPLPLKHHDQ